MIRQLPSIVVCLVACALSACGTTTAYQGPPRPRGESATIVTVNTAIEEIDGNEVEPIRTRRLQFSLPAGPHVVWVRLHKTSPWWGTPTLISGHKELCLDAKAGAHYAIKGAVDEGSWRENLIVVENRMTPVDTDCGRARLFPGASPAVRRAVPPTPLAFDEPPVGTGETHPVALELPPPPPPPLPPSAVPEIVARWRGQPLWRPPAVPVLDLIFNLRAAVAADPETFARVPDGIARHAADAAASLGLLVTPLWLLGDRLGVGVGGELDLKMVRTATPDGSLPFWRMPTATTAHTLIRGPDDWFLLLAGGLESQPIVRVTGSAAAGTTNRTFSAEFGWVARIGAYHHLSEAVAMTTAVGYTHMNYAGADISTVNCWLGLHASMRRRLRESDVPSLRTKE